MKRPILELVKFGGYPWQFLLAVGATQAQTFRALHRYHQRPGYRCDEACLPKDDADAGRDGRVLEMREHDRGQVTLLKCGAVVFLLRDARLGASVVGTVAHEGLHLLCHFTLRAGMPLTDDSSEEAWCYALGDVVSQIVGILGAHRADGRPIRRRGRRRT